MNSKRYIVQPDTCGEWGIWDNACRTLVTNGLSRLEAEEAAAVWEAEWNKDRANATD